MTGKIMAYLQALLRNLIHQVWLAWCLESKIDRDPHFTTRPIWGHVMLES